MHTRKLGAVCLPLLEETHPIQSSPVTPSSLFLWPCIDTFSYHPRPGLINHVKMVLIHSSSNNKSNGAGVLTVSVRLNK